MDKIVLIIPLIKWYFVSSFCTIRHLDIDTVLYSLIGIAWYLTRSSVGSVGGKGGDWWVDILYSTNTTLSAYWLYLDQCQQNKKDASYVLYGLILSTILIMIYSFNYNKFASVLLIPYFGWLIWHLFLLEKIDGQIYYN